MIVTQNTKLNAVPGGIIPVVHVSQFDVNRAISFTIYDGNAPAVLSEGTTVSIEGTKPDGYGFAYTGTLVDNVATFNTTDQMTVLSGSIECKLILSLNSQVIGTAMFILDIEKAAIDGNTDMSETEIPAIIELASQQESNAEAWAVGTRGGNPVPPTDPTYNNSSEWWARYAESAVTGVTGVKGNAEADYRRGNVNITHADLGMDTAPTPGSINPVESNGIYETLQPITSSIVSIGGRVTTLENNEPIETEGINKIIGDTSVTFTNSAISTASELHLLSENTSNTPVFYTAVSVSSGSATYTFPALTEATTFYLVIK